MKKLFIHGEYMCILNLIALPCLTMFYTHNNLIFWILLVFLDIANFILLDQEAFMQAIFDKECRNQHKHAGMRILIYVITYLVFLVFIACTQPIALALIVFANDIIDNCVNVLLYKFLKREHPKVS